jgi:hypothetical protein
MNWEIIIGNLAEARDQIERLEKQINTGDFPNDVEFQILMQHAFHHLNFAWNIRNESIERYASMTDADFRRWGEFPKDLAFED